MYSIFNQSKKGVLLSRFAVIKIERDQFYQPMANRFLSKGWRSPIGGLGDGWSVVNNCKFRVDYRGFIVLNTEIQHSDKNRHKPGFYRVMLTIGFMLYCNGIGQVVKIEVTIILLVFNFVD